MGVWGYDDSENDGVYDEWFKIEDAVLPQIIKDIKHDDHFRYDSVYDLVRDIMLDSQKAIYAALKKYVEEKKQSNDQFYEGNSFIVGIVLYCIKFFNNKGITKKTKHLPTEFPVEFPKSLITECRKINAKMIEDTEKNPVDKKRKAMLLKQQELFETGRAREGKLSKSRRK